MVVSGSRNGGTRIGIALGFLRRPRERERERETSGKINHRNSGGGFKTRREGYYEKWASVSVSALTARAHTWLCVIIVFAVLSRPQVLRGGVY